MTLLSCDLIVSFCFVFFFQAEDGIRDLTVTGVQTCALPIYSWGGMLAMEYALTRPAGLASLVLASAPASIPQWVAETGRLRSQLPADVQEGLDRHEAAGTTDDPEYGEAALGFYPPALLRGRPWA